MADEHQFKDETIDHTSSEDLLAIRAYDSTVEIVGFVDSIEATKIVGAAGHEIFKFFMNNGMGDRIQIITWNKEIARIEQMIRINYIVHSDGAYCKPCVNRNFNRGTVLYELIIQSNTVVNVLGKYAIASADDQTIPELVEIKDVAQFNSRIRVQGFIKSNIAVMKKRSGMGNDLKCGSITDGEWKLEIHVPIPAETKDNDELDFEKGDHIEAIGTAQVNGEYDDDQ